MAEHKYHGLVLALTIIGSLLAALSVAVFEGFVPSSWVAGVSAQLFGVLAGVLYIIAILIYAGS